MKHRQPNAAQVSRTLSQAGHVKATAYQTFAAREQDGFIVTRHSLLGHVKVLHSTASRRPEVAAPLVEAWAETLTEAGYRVRVVRSNDGHARNIAVERWDDA